jgi:hypothetical protein
MIKLKVKALIKIISTRMNSVFFSCFASSTINNDYFFFVHIPKTAGTSFRNTLEARYGVINDYGLTSGQTNKVVKNNIYINNYPYGLLSHLRNKPSGWICGHVSLEKYINFVPVAHTVAFVRAPLGQFISHCNHSIEKHQFEGDLEGFLSKRGTSNLQSRLLSYLPLGLIGHVAITEHYDDSLKIINSHFDINLKTENANVNNTKKFDENNIEHELASKILEKNQRDVNLYNEACFIHHQRLNFLKAGKPWVYACATIDKHNVITGCAYYADSDNPVELTLFRNNVEIKQCQAQDFFNDYAKANFPRDRYIAFHFSLTELIKPLASDDSFDIYVKATGQQINYKSLITHASNHKKRT